MHHTLTKLPKSQVEVLVTLPFSEFEPHVKKAAALISEEVAIEGFRKGKAPYEIVRDKVGEHAIYERGAEEAVHRTWPGILKELADREPYATHPFIGRPEITVTKLAPGNDLEYKVCCGHVPEITLPDYKAVARRVREGKKETAISEEEVAKAVDWVRESRSQLMAVDRTAALGDAVEIDFEMRHGGVKIEQGEARNHAFVLGKAGFIPGFEDALVGMAAGEVKTFTLVVPADWRDSALAGKALEAKVVMRLVQEHKLPELTDEFVKMLGSFDSVQALEASVREGLEGEKKEKEKQRIRIMIIDEIAQAANIDTPDLLVAAELDKMLAELQSGVNQMGMQWDQYLLHVKKGETELKEGWREEAVRRVRVALCLRQIARLEHIDPTGEEITEAANKYLQQFASSQDAQKTIDPEALADYTRGVLRNEKVFEFLEHVV
ncbi:MAG: trigger factor [Candidatus Sungbacteria bacterium]|nr:trigger factor [Candidatus Sungbacteria bacterium]